MTIRSKLTLEFALISASIMITASFFIYYLSAIYRKEEFYDRLLSKAQNTAKLLIEVHEVDTDLLKIIDKNTISLPAEQIIIYNYLNEEIYNSNEAIRTPLDKQLLNEIRLIHEVRFQQQEKEVLGILYTDPHNRFVVLASATDVYGLRKLKNLRLVLLSVFGGSMLLLVAGGWIFAHLALRPMAHVIGQVGQISGSNLDARVDEGNGQDEIAQLSHTFNKMLDRVEQAFHAQTSFVANASHELRTPLTAITGQIEVSLFRERGIEEYQRVLKSVLEDIKQLTNLSNMLLKLAQVTPESKMHLEPVRIDELLFQSRIEVLQRDQRYHIDVEYVNFPEEEYQLLLMGNESLLKSAIGNLIDNACKFSEKQPVKITLTFHDHETIMTIIDQGIGIEEEDLQQIFNPLYRASNAMGFQGHGLGLSLAYKIFQMHRIRMHLSSAIHQGTIVTLILPTLKATNQIKTIYY